MATAREVGEKIPEDVEPFRLYGDVGKTTTVQDIQWALSALNIPTEIKTDNNGEQFVQVDPFLEVEASTKFMELVASGEVGGEELPINLQQWAELYLLEINSQSHQ
jgi:hypothetical protein